MAAPEAVMICIDDSNCVSQQPSLLLAQKEAIQLYCQAKFKSNPANVVGLATMAKPHLTILRNPTKNLDDIQLDLQNIRGGGTFELLDGILNAQLGFLDRYLYCTTTKKKRHLIFIGGPLCLSHDELERLGRRLKDRGIAVDVVAFDCCNDVERKERLDTFMAAANNNNNSRIAYVPSGSCIRDVLLRSKLLPWSFRKRLAASVAMEEDATYKAPIEDVEPKETSPKDNQEKAKKKKKQSRKVKNQAAAAAAVDDVAAAAASADVVAAADVEECDDIKQPEWVTRQEFEALVKEFEKLKLKFQQYI